MSEPFLAEIKIVGFNFPPRGWAQCDGQILPINQNQSLFSLLGTTFGGDGRTSFALPDMRSRLPVHPGNSNAGTNFTLGQKTGEETHALTAAEIPNHTHALNAAQGVATASTIAGNLPAGNPQSINMFNPDASGGGNMTSGTVTSVGAGQAHENMQPFTTLNFCIALQGIFPSRN